MRIYVLFFSLSIIYCHQDENINKTDTNKKLAQEQQNEPNILGKSFNVTKMILTIYEGYSTCIVKYRSEHDQDLTTIQSSSCSVITLNNLTPNTEYYLYYFDDVEILKLTIQFKTLADYEISTYYNKIKYAAIDLRIQFTSPDYYILHYSCSVRIISSTGMKLPCKTDLCNHTCKKVKLHDLQEDIVRRVNSETPAYLPEYKYAMSNETKPNVTFDVTMTTIKNPIIKVNIDSNHSFENCTTVATVNGNPIPAENITTSCSSIQISPLIESSQYKLNFTYGEFAEPFNFTTIKEYHLFVRNSSTTCNSSNIDMSTVTIDPPTLKINCSNKIIDPPNTNLTCEEPNCETICTSIKLNRLMPGTKYTFLSEFLGNEHYYPENKTVTFTTQQQNGAELIVIERSTSNIMLSIKLSLRGNFTCIVTLLQNNQPSFKKVEESTDCSNVVFTDLKPNTKYQASIEFIPDDFCNTAQIDVATPPADAELVILSISPSSIFLNIKSNANIAGIPLGCTVIITKQGVRISRVINNCTNASFHDLQGNTIYKINLTSPYISHPVAIEVRTDSDCPIPNISALLKNDTLFLNLVDPEISENVSVGVILKGKVFKQYNLLEDNKTESIKGQFNSSIVLDRLHNKSVIGNIRSGILYKLMLCSSFTNSNCSNLYDECLNCSAQDFFSPSIKFIPSRNISYDSENELMTVSYILPNETETGLIEFLVIYAAMDKVSFSGRVTFYQRHIFQEVDNNTWYTAFTVSKENILKSGNVTFSLFENKNTSNYTLKGRYYLVAVGFCSNITCITSELYDRTFVSAGNELTEHIILGISCGIFLILLTLHIFFTLQAGTPPTEDKSQPIDRALNNTYIEKANADVEALVSRFAGRSRESEGIALKDGSLVDRFKPTGYVTLNESVLANIVQSEDTEITKKD